MNRYFLTKAFVLTSLAFIVGKSYACNIPPVARLTANPQYLMWHNSVTLDGSGSYDPDGNGGIQGIVKFEFDRDGDGTTYEYCETPGSCPDGVFDGKTTYTYNTVGTHTVHLRVTDNIGAPTTTECKVYVKIPVPDKDNGIYTIQNAIGLANNGTIIVVSPGTYAGDIDFGGKAITVQSTDPNNPAVVAATIIDCENNHRGFRFQSGETNSSVLAGFTITNGYHDNGGGIYCSNASPTIANCVINNNTASYYYGGGGAIYCENASPTITNCVISNNTATAYGGGMYAKSANPLVKNCVFSQNRAKLGGGVYTIQSSPKFVNCVFSQNHAESGYNGWGGYGGGICSDNSSTEVINCTFSGNIAYAWGSQQGYGGGIANDNPTAPSTKITNCIFWSNKREDDNGNELTGQDAQISWWNVSPDVKHSCIQDGNPGDGSIPFSGDNNINKNTDGDPRFINAEDPPGPDGIFGTLDDGLALQPDTENDQYSPCIDGGNNNYVPGDITTDVIGNPRKADGDHNLEDTERKTVDMGAYEIVPVWYVKASATGTGDGKSWSAARKYLQDALADAVAGDEIWVAQGIYKPDQGGGKTPGDRTATFQLVSGVAIYGGFAGTEALRSQRDLLKNVTTLSGDIDGDGFLDNENSNNVVKGANNATIDGFTITGGNANASNFGGGGIYCSNTSPKITNCTITGNNAYMFGGGIYCNSASPAVISCTITNNKSCYGGGICSRYNSSNPTLVNCTLSGNSAVVSGFWGGMGGGMFNQCSLASVTNCTFSGNTAPHGGGMNNHMSNPTVTSCVFTGNSATNGGGMYNMYNNYESGSRPPALTNCTFSKNSATNGSGGGMYNYYYSTPALTNCIFWGDTATTSGAEIFNSSANPSFSHCDIQGGMPAFSTDLGGNIDLDPNFVDAENPAGPDGKFYTDDDGLQLCVFDPRHGDLQTPFNGSCLDSADGTAAPWTDITGRPRMDVAYIPNNGSGLVPYTDMGAYESPCVWYVKKGGRGAGWSWDFAADNPQEVIKKARDGDEIWVAAGEYKPGKERTDTFLLDKAIAIYGGFKGSEYYRHKRNWIANETILSGEIGDTDGDDRWIDNCYHVVQVESDGAVLDGFTITSGYTLEGDNSYDCVGGGVIILDSSPKIENCIIRNNYTYYGGGGMCVANGSPTIMNCVFYANIEYSSGTWYGGGAMRCYRSTPIVINCIFSRNTAYQGGAIFNYESNPAVINCVFRENEASYGPGIYNTNDSSLVVTNCVFTGNLGRYYGGCVYNLSIIELNNCTFAWNKTAGTSSTSLWVYADHVPLIRNCIFWGADNSKPQVFLSGGVDGCVGIIGNCDIGDSPDDLKIDSGSIQDKGGIIYTDPHFVANNPEFYDETTESGREDSIRVENASKYAVGDVIQYEQGDSEARMVVKVYPDDGIVVFDSPLGSPSVKYQKIANWGKYAITEIVDENYIRHYQVRNMIARLQPDTSPCIDAGTDEGVPLDVYDLDGDDHIYEKTPCDINGVPRIQKIKQNNDAVDMGALECGGLTAGDVTVNEISEDTDSPITLPMQDLKVGGGPPDFEIVTYPKHGTLTKISNNQVKYKTYQDYCDDPADPKGDVFYYKATDGTNHSELAKVVVSKIMSVEDNPVAVADVAWVNPVEIGDGSIIIDVLANDYDTDPGDILSTVEIGLPEPSHGTAINQGDKVKYTPSNHASPLPDSFSYRMRDQKANLSNYATVTVNVNQRPVANDDPQPPAEAFVTKPNIIAVMDVLANDTDPDGHTFKIVDIVQPAKGEVKYYEDLNRNIKRLVYKPASADPLADNLTFTYKIEDEFGLKSSNAANVKVSVKETADIVDSDGDLLSDADEENIFHTNPNDPDYDNDGIFDGQEVMNGIDPTNPYMGDYYAEKLPYSTCFGTNQGYAVDQSLDRQQGWKLVQGNCQVGFEPELCYIAGPYFFGGFLAHLACNSLISKEFEDKGADDENSNIIRVKLYPSENAEVLICCGDTVIAGAKFVKVGDECKVAVWTQGVYQASATAWSEWVKPSEVPQYEKGNHSYAKMLKFETNFGNKTYKMWWDDTQDNTDYPVQVEVGGTGTLFALGGNVDRITHVKFKSGGTEFEVRGLYINAQDSEDGIAAITNPCHCDEVSQSRVPVLGSTLSPNISSYELRYSMSPYSETGIAKEFWRGYRPVSNGVLGYWNTGALPNGLYDVEAVRRSELYYYYYDTDNNLHPTDWAWYYDCSLYSGWLVNVAVVEDIAVSGQLKATFHYVEEPDISVPWPGLFPFELRRIYNGHRCINQFKDGFFPGWTHNNNITLVEDAGYHEPYPDAPWDNDDDDHKADYDNNMLAFGAIYVQYEDGSTHLFRHKIESKQPSNTVKSIYVPVPDDGSGDYVKRISELDDLDYPWYISEVRYSLHRADGTVIEFYPVTPDDPYNINPRVYIFYYYYGHFLIDQSNNWSEPWRFKTVAKQKSDRLGNTLYFNRECIPIWAWNYDHWVIIGGNWYVNEVYYNQRDTTKISINLDFDWDGYIKVYRYFWAKLQSIDISGASETFRTVDYDYEWYQEGDSYYDAFVVSQTGKKAQEDGTLNDDTLRQTTYLYNDLYDGDLNLIAIFSYKPCDSWGQFTPYLPPSTLLYYDDMGRVSERYDYVDEETCLPTYYCYDYFDDPYASNPPPEDGQWLCTTAATPYQITYTINSNKGQLMAQLVEPSDSSAAKQVFYEYANEGSGPPFEPKEIYEYWEDYNLDSAQFVQRERKTVNTFGQRELSNFGSKNPVVRVWDVREQSVYDPADAQQPSDILLAHNERDYHPYAHYNLETKRTSYQKLVLPNGPHEKPVQTEYVYAERLQDGTYYDNTTNPQKNKYMVQEIVLLDENASPPNNEAVTSFEHNHQTGPGPDGDWNTTDDNPYVLTEMVDPKGNTTLYEYDTYHFKKWVKVVMNVQGQPTEVPIERYCHDEIGQMRLKADAKGLVTLYDYDGFGNVYKIRTYHDPDAFSKSDDDFTPTYYSNLTPRSTTIYTYDVHCRRNFEKTFSQEAGPNPTVAVKRTEYTAVNTSDCPMKVTFDDNNSGTVDSYVAYLYDERGLKISEFNYDATTDLWWFKDYYYDGLDRLCWTVWWDYEDKTILKLLANEYNGSGKKWYEDIWGLDEEGQWNLERRTDYKYDLLDRPHKRIVTYGEGPNDKATTEYFYDAVSNLIGVKDPIGRYLFSDYDNANRRTKEYFAVEYNQNFETTKSSAIIRKTTGYYLNNLVKDVKSYDYYSGSPPGPGTLLEHTQFEYDERSRLKKVTEKIKQNPDDFADTTFAYKDAKDGMVIETGGPKYAYTIITDAALKNTTVVYNERGGMIQTTYPSADKQKLRYNGDGTLGEKAVWDTGGNEKQIEYTYDAFKRLEQISYPDSPTRGTLTYSYDGFGRIIQVVDNRNSEDRINGTGAYANKISYEYDPLSRVIGVTDQDGYKTKYLYRGDGQKLAIRVTSPADSVNPIYSVKYDYDYAGRLTKVKEPPLPAGSDAIAKFDYDQNGNRDLLTYFRNGSEIGPTTSIDYDYNPDNLLIHFTTTSSPTLTFSFSATDSGDIDGLGRLKNADETISKTSGQVTHNYTLNYDMRSQLTNPVTITNIGGGNWTANYGYRKDGNLDSRSGTTFQYNGDLMTGTVPGGGESFSLAWDDNGNLKQKTTATNTTLVYNWDNKLRSGTSGSNSIALKYDPDGNRIRKQSGASTVRKYIVDIVADLPTILLEIGPGADGLLGTGDDVVAKTYIYGNSQILAQHTGKYDQPRYFYLHDRLGSVREVIDSAGSVKNFYTYNPFGEVFATENTENVSNPFKFTGQYYDSEIAEYYLRARQYDPHIARFTGRDPVEGDFEEPLTLHVYLYCINDPINNTDLSGEDYTKEETLTATGAGAAIEAAIDTGVAYLAYRLTQRLVEQMEINQIVLSLATASDRFLDMAIVYFATSKDYKFKGGKITTRDRWYGLEKMPDFNKFQRWFHKVWKQKTKIKNPTPEDMWEAYDDFVNNWKNWSG